MSANQAQKASSTRPYLIRALHEWCCDNGFTPYITVSVDNSVQVPREYVKDDEIVLNIGFDATTALNIGNEYLEFKARFSGAVRDIMVPIDQITAIFARENGQGMAFPMADVSERKPSISKAPTRATISLAQSAPDLPGDNGQAVDAGMDSGNPQNPDPTPPRGPKPALTRIK
jgi:stringent starvation protein B